MTKRIILLIVLSWLALCLPVKAQSLNYGLYTNANTGATLISCEASYPSRQEFAPIALLSFKIGACWTFYCTVPIPNGYNGQTLSSPGCVVVPAGC
jgi:hypothetical protein